MMLNYSGWKKGYGPFDQRISFDESRADWEIRFTDGATFHQVTLFGKETRDWNHDGYVRPQFGAWFRCENNAQSEFFTPQDMLRLVVDEEANIPGLPDPSAPIKERIKQLEESKLQEKAEAKRARIVSVKGEHGCTINALFDATKFNYHVKLAEGKSYFQTSDFDERPANRVDRGATTSPLFGAWFQSSAEVLDAHYFTPEELVQMVIDKKADVDGLDLKAQTKKSLCARENER